MSFEQIEPAWETIFLYDIDEIDVSITNSVKFVIIRLIERGTGYTNQMVTDCFAGKKVPNRQTIQARLACEPCPQGASGSFGKPSAMLPRIQRRGRRKPVLKRCPGVADGRFLGIQSVRILCSEPVALVDIGCINSVDLL